jgi:hypothetical protein
MPKKVQIPQERVEYYVFLFDGRPKGSQSLKIFKISLTFRFDKLSNLSKSVHIGENSQILTVSNKKQVYFHYGFSCKKVSLSLRYAKNKIILKVLVWYRSSRKYNKFVTINYKQFEIHWFIVRISFMTCPILVEQHKFCLNLTKVCHEKRVQMVSIKKN